MGDTGRWMDGVDGTKGTGGGNFAEALGCVCFTLRKTARAVTQFYNVALEPSGLLATQFSLLAALAVDGPARQRVLAERLGMDPTTLTRNLRVLERRALVDIRLDPEDRRAQRIALTAAGRAALEDAWPLWKEAQGATIARLGVGLWGDLARDLERVTATAPLP